LLTLVNFLQQNGAILPTLWTFTRKTSPIPGSLYQNITP